MSTINEHYLPLSNHEAHVEQINLLAFQKGGTIYRIRHLMPVGNETFNGW